MRPWKIGDVVIRKFVNLRHVLTIETAMVTKMRQLDGAEKPQLNLGPNDTWATQWQLECDGWYVLTENGETKQD